MNAAKRTSPLMNEQGAAFPVALLGLLVSSILMSALLVTSSVEGVVSRAHRDAVTDLYEAEGALNAYLADQAGRIAPATVTGFRATPTSEPVTITVAQVAQRSVAGATERVYAITAQPTRGGRMIAAMVRMAESAGVSLNIESAAVFGGRAEISGNSAFVHDGSDGDLPAGTVRSCSADSAAANAIVHAAAAQLTYQNRDNIVGGIEQSTLGKEELIRQTLGSSIRGLLPHAEVKFGAHFGEPAFIGSGNNKPSSLNNNGSVRGLGHKYNWRCPGRMEQSTYCVAAGADTTHFPIIAIDGENRNVTINGDHGQGMLIVINGRLNIQGGFIFKGVVVGEQDIDIAGTGNKISGAVISQNNVNVQQQVANDSTTTITGNAVIVYNRCAINQVAQVLNPNYGNPTVTSNTRAFAWAEIVR